MMKYFITLAFTAVMLQPTHAQTAEQKYIEVTVTDSVIIKPDVIEYSISLQRDYSSMEMPAAYDDNTDNTDYMNELKRLEEEAKMKMEIQEKKLKDYITKSKVNYKKIEAEKSYEDYGYKPSTSYLLTFKSSEDLTAFINGFPEDIQYRGELVSMRCSNTVKYEDKLLDKIITKANTQARKIASASGVKLGAMIQYSDNVNEIAKGIEESIRTLMRESKRNRESYFFENMLLNKTVRIRFAIE